MKKHLLATTGIAAIAAFSAPAAFAHCGGAFCALNTNWDVQGVWDKPGVRLDLRAEYINLDQLRHGTDKVGPSAEVDEHDETRTINRNFVGSLDWSIDQDWGLTLRVPVVDRSHSHVHNHEHMGEIEQHHESWDFTDVGDVRAVGRYVFYHGENSDAGINFGLKLPTGKIDVKNSDGEEAERSLQPGTGSTDGILGLYYNRHMGVINWYAQGMWQDTLHERDDYRPGYKLGLDVGVNYLATPGWSLMLQLNVQNNGHDSGANAESNDSGGTYAFLSPGVSYRVTRDAQIYGFWQQPIYQRVNGTQLTADWAASAGMSMQF
jgi:hypothetical protein